MAEGLRYFLKRFGKAYSIDQWKVFQSFDPEVKGKYRSSQKLALPVSAIASETHESLKKENSAYTELGMLVRDRIGKESASTVAALLVADACSVADEYEKRWDKQVDCSLDTGRALRLSFVDDAAFREEFQAKLRADHAAQDFEGFWRSIDALMDELHGVWDPEAQREVVVEAQRDIVASFILACLLGARDYRQDLGRAPEMTPGLSQRARLGGGGATRARVLARLVAVTRVGEGADEYLLPADASELELYELDGERSARIGRERAWCAGKDAVAVVTSARYASGRHAEISFDSGTWWLADCSKNGTLVTRAGCKPDEFGNVAAVFAQCDGACDVVELHHGDLICLAPQPVAGISGLRYRAAYEGAKNYRFEVLG